VDIPEAGTHLLLAASSARSCSFLSLCFRSRVAFSASSACCARACSRAGRMQARALVAQKQARKRWRHHVTGPTQSTQQARMTLQQLGCLSACLCVVAACTGQGWSTQLACQAMQCCVAHGAAEAPPSTASPRYRDLPRVA
jgi:hypothetical protein